MAESAVLLASGTLLPHLTRRRIQRDAPHFALTRPTMRALGHPARSEEEF